MSIRVADFTEFPGPRYIEQGDDSGELFYYEVLKGLFGEILERNQSKGQIKLLVDLDHTAGYASSFLDEAFGNLAYDFGQKAVIDHLEIKSEEEPDWINIIFTETIPEWDRKKRNGIDRKPGLSANA